ncbi:hypothetical protein LDENG_00030630 [Lucifuga dentata]|nr:hypothetical protein LDENG_00030630 [Lucifuga dentata]
MDRYESLGLVGEGSYGTVLKCRHRDSGRLVAIKKFLDSDNDKMVKKIAQREIKLLRIIHRDIKPENILISHRGVVKLCDFGFARTMASPAEDGVYTDYVATRWYRAPELLVGDTKYGKPVDVWAVGCLLIEMLTGQPLFPGDSDLDQIYHIVRCFGNLTAHHQQLFHRNPVFAGVRLPECSIRDTLEQRYPTITHGALDLTQRCLQMDPETRTQCSELLEHLLFTHDGFHISGGNSPASGGDLSQGGVLQPVTHGLRFVDKPKQHGGSYNRRVHQSLPTYITETPTTQVSSEKNTIGERSFLSDHSNLGNSDGVAKWKCSIHFPDLRSTTLPELRGRDGKNSKGVTKDQRKDKQPE